VSTGCEYSAEPEPQPLTTTNRVIIKSIYEYSHSRYYS